LEKSLSFLTVKPSKHMSHAVANFTEVFPNSHPTPPLSERTCHDEEPVLVGQVILSREVHYRMPGGEAKKLSTLLGWCREREKID